MNVLIALYGDFSSNSAVPLMLHARELQRSGHHCVVAVPAGLEGVGVDPPFLPALYREALASPTSLFPDGRPADVVHAWNPREGVRRFCTAYLAKHPAPLVIYLEDNEDWIARRALAMVGIREDVLLEHSTTVIATWTPEGISNVLHYRNFIGLADAAVVIQDKLACDVPPWVPCSTVMPGVDLEVIQPRPPDPALRQRYGIAEDERVIVYPGGLNDFTRPGLETLCRAVGMVNQRGIPCRLLRTGPVPLDFLDRLTPETTAKVSDLGVLARDELPPLLALADVLVQPGTHDAFEDLRLPGKLPEFLASGRPVVLPETNIAPLLRDGVDAVFHRTGTPEEIAERCTELFADPEKARRIGESGRRFAEAHFDPRAQAARLEGVYRTAIESFDRQMAGQVWGECDAALSPPALLARKLHLRAQAGRSDPATPSALLEAHARLIEAALAREAGLEEGMAVRDRELAPIRGAIASRDARISVLESAASERRAHVANLERSLVELDGHIAFFRQAIAERDHHIATMESTFSWRITAPIRAAGRLARRLASALFPARRS